MIKRAYRLPSDRAQRGKQKEHCSTFDPRGGVSNLYLTGVFFNHGGFCADINVLRHMNRTAEMILNPCMKLREGFLCCIKLVR
jgi:hypothetical protein